MEGEQEAVTWGYRVQWKVGDRAKWFGATYLLRPLGATWNPPPPGWSAPTQEDIDRKARICRNLHVTILEVVEDPPGQSLPVRAVADDGTEIDPSADMWCLVSASHDGWVHPDPKRQRRGLK